MMEEAGKIMCFSLLPLTSDLLHPKQGIDGIVRGYLLKANLGRYYQMPVDLTPMFEELNIAGGSSEASQKVLLQLDTSNLTGKFQGTGSVAENLNPFWTGNFLKEPAAASVHQQGVTLHFQKAQGV
jgi:hypothetical protein